MMARLALTGALALAFGACQPEGYQEPGPDTSPAVSLPYSDYYLVEVDPTLTPVTFGPGSTDLAITIVGQEADGQDHVIDFGAPAETRMTGYGEYDGYTETFRRSVVVDKTGTHGVRIAVYRTDSGREHTNLWTHTLARSKDAGIFLIDQAEWNWIGGEEDLAGFSEGVWPFYSSMQRSHYFYDSFFGFTPGIYSRTEYLRQVILSTKATSPTHGVESCVQVLFNAVTPGLRHVAYLHERYGLVEVVYDFRLLDADEALAYPIVPIDGFATPKDDLEPLPEPEATPSELRGRWSGVLSFVSEGPDGEQVVTDRSATVEFAQVGTHYRALTDSYDIDGRYSDAETSVHLRGRYTRGERQLEAMSGRSFDDVGIWAERRFESGLAQLDVQLFRSVGDSYENGFGVLTRE